MKFSCCGIVYSTNDVETFECIEKDVITSPTVREYNGKKITKEIVYTLSCKKNNCTKIKVYRMGLSKFGQSKALETIEMSGLSAITYLQETELIRKRQAQICPLKPIPSCKTIPFVYGKVISATEQRPRYINETGYRDIAKAAIIEKIYWDENLKRKTKQILQYSFIPDIIKFQVKISK